MPNNVDSFKTMKVRMIQVYLLEVTPNPATTLDPLELHPASVG